MARKCGKLFEFNKLPVFLGILVGITAQAANRGVERYSATVEDGTAKEIRATTSVDDGHVDESLSQHRPTKSGAHTVLRPPQKLSATIKQSDAATEMADLRRQNSELSKRLNALEQAKIEANSETKAAEPMVDPATQASDAATGTASATTLPATKEVKTIPAAALADKPLPVPATTEPSKLAPSSATGPTPTGIPNAPVVVVFQNTAPALAPTPAPTPAPAAAPLTSKAPEPTLETEKKPSKFDNVPTQHIGDIAQRLKYTNEILKRFGRAYDYRSTTLKEFRSILSELEANEEKTKDTN